MTLAVLLALSIFALVACTGSGEDAAEEGSEPTSAAVTSAEPKPCTAVEVRELVVGFVQAFNRGDDDALNGLFAPEPSFRWYSTDAPGERLRSEAYNRASLIPYFARRHAAGERLRLTSFKFNGNSPGIAARYGNFEYGLVRSADDLPPTNYYGKGASSCYGDRPDLIFVWSMG
jgi:hypothetical protein